MQMQIYKFSDIHEELFEWKNKQEQEQEQTKSNWSTNETAWKLIPLQVVVSPPPPFSWSSFWIYPIRVNCHWDDVSDVSIQYRLQFFWNTREKASMQCNTIVRKSPVRLLYHPLVVLVHLSLIKLSKTLCWYDHICVCLPDRNRWWSWLAH